MSESTGRARVDSIDVFRGMTVALMILVNNPGSWSHVYPPLRHAEWLGWTLTDLVFPFFLFIVGVSAWFSTQKFGHRLTGPAFRKILLRTAGIFLIGVFLNAFPFCQIHWETFEVSARSWESFRVLGVLQRIALSYGLGVFLCLLFRGHVRLLTWLSVAILLGYWWLFHVHDVPDPFGREWNILRTFDLWLFGESHLYRGYGLAFDPESVLGSISGSVTVILGFLAGSRIDRPDSPRESVFSLLFTGPLLIVLAYLWDLVFPISKPLWTSSYVLLTAGLGSLALAYTYWNVDVQKRMSGWRWGGVFFRALGSNPLLMFVLTGMVAKTLLPWLTTRPWYRLCYSALELRYGENLTSLLYAVSLVLLMGLVAIFLHTRRIYVRI
ncbi:MAG: heparan-alpha-glucosaminide N-acetyltransferase domain-containing protein [Planctomycetia bacterium]|nr:heparan-alpha-glucosaminide N-acetyltransferase domain-containing protein [Planctomycetia bacterium]